MENIETLLAAVAQTQGFDDDEPLDSIKSPEIRLERTRSELNGASNDVSKDALPPVDIPAISSVEKRKRGRPPKAKLVVKPPPPKKMKLEDEEEDVCFICFDGGSLVLCDRKGCPKAYHPSCIKRDEAFFKSKAKWNCGWHICMVCQKASHYMCYTCTYSLCKACSKDADYLCVRGNKGFCPTCLKTIMLIENKDHPNNDSVQVDFDDRTSWEYLFKVYWVYLKEKLSLTRSELNQTKRPGKGVAAMTCKPQPSNAQQNAVNGKVSISNRSSEPLELNKPQKETDFPQDIESKGASDIDNHEEMLNSTVKEDAPSCNEDAERPSSESFTAKPSIVKGTDDPSTEKATEKLGVDKDADNLRIVDDADKPCICRTRDKPRNEDPDKPETGNVAEQASASGKEEASPQAQNRIIEKPDENGSLSLPKHINQINVANSAIGGGNDQAMQRSELETSTATASMGNSPTANSIETEKLWHYRDLNGTILGPFSLLLLQKWSTTGLLPTDMRIWKNHEQLDSVILADALSRQFNGAQELLCNTSSDSLEHGATGEIRASEGISGTDNYSKQTEPACSKRTSDMSDSNTGFMRTDNSSSSTWPQCWDLLKDSNSGGDDVRVHNELPSSSLEHTPVASCDRAQKNGDLNHGSQDKENNSGGLTQNQTSNGDDLQNQANNQSQALPSSNRNLRSLCIDLRSRDLAPESGFALARSSADAIQQDNNGDILDMHNPTAKTGNEHWRVQTDEEQQSLSSDVPMQKSSFLELLSLTPRSSNGDQAAEKKQSNFLDLPGPNSVPNWSTASNLAVGALLPEVPDEWCGKPPVQEWDCGLVSAPSARPPELASEDLAISNLNNNQLGHASPSHAEANIPNWLALINEPIEFDALGEESVSDLLAEVDAMESQGGMPSPTSAVKFAKEFIQYCKDDCFSSIEEFGAGKSDALSSTAEVRLTPLPTLPCKPNEAAPIDTLDFFKISGMHSSTSSEGESSAPVYSGEAGAEFHPPVPNNTNRETIGANMAPGIGSEPVQGNINLVTVQGNVNLVLGGPAQGMSNIGWGTNAGAAWANPNINHSPINGNLTRDGQRKYGGEKFASPRERSFQGNETGFISPRERSYQGNETGFISSRERSYQGNETGFIRARPPWGREPYGGGRYSRPPPKGQRVCKFYESGRCKKGAFCDYLHP